MIIPGIIKLRVQLHSATAFNPLVMGNIAAAVALPNTLLDRCGGESKGKCAIEPLGPELSGHQDHNQNTENPRRNPVFPELVVLHRFAFGLGASTKHHQKTRRARGVL